MLEQKWQNSLFATQKQENDWVYTPNQGALRCVPPVPLSRLAGYALAVLLLACYFGQKVDRNEMITRVACPIYSFPVRPTLLSY
jgi:hypothetical protein